MSAREVSDMRASYRALRKSLRSLLRMVRRFAKLLEAAR
jgi:hypothetical protein